MVCSELRWAVVWLRVESAESWVLMAQSQVEVRSIVVGVCLFFSKGLLPSPGWFILCTLLCSRKLVWVGSCIGFLW